MSHIPVSVVVVSRHRPGELVCCIKGLAQSDHPMIEVIVVADATGLAAAQAAAPGPIKGAVFDAPNISAARNIGLGLAAGAVVAFIDDDAVPEPTWASRLTAPFADPQVAAAGGFVRGRNGISYQWQARTVDETGQPSPLAVGRAASLHQGTGGRAIKTEGTNMAFRRSVLAEMGGFDPALQFYMDETDVNLRLAAMGAVTAIVPGAEVHHAFAASARRSADRVPLSLHDIGASTMVVLRKHAPPHTHGGALAALRAEQRARLLRLVVGGQLEPRDVALLMATLERGVAAGLAVTPAPLPPIGAAAAAFCRLQGTGPRPGRVVAGWWFQKAALRADAMRRTGEIVTVLRFTPTALYHRMRFHADGYWEQTGGLWGRAERQGRLIRPLRFQPRVAQECARLASVRPVDETDC